MSPLNVYADFFFHFLVNTSPPVRYKFFERNLRGVCGGDLKYFTMKTEAIQTQRDYAASEFMRQKHKKF